MLLLILLKSTAAGTVTNSTNTNIMLLWYMPISVITQSYMYLLCYYDTCLFQLLHSHTCTYYNYNHNHENDLCTLSQEIFSKCKSLQLLKFSHKSHTRRNLNSYSRIGRPPVFGFSHPTVYSYGQAPVGSDRITKGYGTAANQKLILPALKCQ